ncbi:hypothetical protein [Tenacibaculum sp. 190524A02b]|uniref:hypothetical protein n=1 Tax=Tenacibaculum vairaonense TaxID=3137860 RepID=UPI0031FAABB7
MENVNNAILERINYKNKNEKMIIRKRLYDGADAFMAESARVIYNLLVKDLEKFTAYNSRFTTDYAANFLVQINAADAVVTDVSIVATQEVLTRNVLKAMREARTIYSRIKSYVELTFGTAHPTIVKEFTSGYRAARRSQPKMLVFLDVLEKLTHKYVEALTNSAKGGMPIGVLNDLVAVKTTLLNANIAQETFKKERLVHTEKRITVLNDCYHTLTQVNKMAQLVFANQPAKKAQYIYKVNKK